MIANINDQNNIKRIFIRGNDIVLHMEQLCCDSIFIIANNIYIDKIIGFTCLVAENIFVESTSRVYKETSLTCDYSAGFICSKNILSIGYGWGVPPFTKSRDELLSQNVYIKRNYSLNNNLYLSAGTYLYGCENEGKSLDSSLSVACYTRIKNLFNNIIDNNRIYEPNFWKLNDIDKTTKNIQNTLDPITKITNQIDTSLTTSIFKAFENINKNM